MIYVSHGKTAADLLRFGLRKEYGINGDVAFTYGPNGKPYLRDHPRIFFNLSHCRLGAACVISEEENGIDMQDVRPFSLRAARRVCTQAELAQIKAAPQPDRLFCKLWAVKEAFVKLRGGSILSGTVDTADVIGRAYLREGEGWWLCCFGNTSPNLIFIDLR
jgi:4'-phosphopantetheinyl transferase